MSDRDQLWIAWLNNHGASDNSVRRFLELLPTDFPAGLDETEVTIQPPKSGLDIGKSAGNSDPRP